ncbi:hypothetical protein BB559_003899 [Furculomyces boomerangus]|uniref:Uncharacterized protein n=2 Tax=Harpellales TaxID=61421 RepID=A0A2T9YI59_9FUNG|nr:hypothetical protein BB559_003899 [Furculomyces boomerangus]PVZ98453.1 hypothetical protein BB558_005548 [Smittium angustum]PWA01997.1 hypothetical protein BB558_001876 [Smittium angustum]
MNTLNTITLRQSEYDFMLQSINQKCNSDKCVLDFTFGRNNNTCMYIRMKVHECHPDTVKKIMRRLTIYMRTNVDNWELVTESECKRTVFSEIAGCNKQNGYLHVDLNI